MKKLKICMISSEFPPSAAGIGYAVYHLSRSLTDKGHRVTVITRGNWKGVKTRVFEGIRIYEAPFIPFPPPFHILFHGYFVNRLLKKLQKDIDIIHLHSPLVPIVNTDVPTITTVHSTWNYEGNAFNKIIDWYSLAVKLFKKSFIKYEQVIFSKTDKFIAISEAMAKELIRHYNVNPSKIHIIRNSIDINKYASVRETGKSNTPFNVLAIGRFVYRKGILDLVDAANIVCRKYPMTVFTIIGDGPLKIQLLKKVQEYKLGNNVILPGIVPNARIKHYLQASSVFVIPSLYEGLPLVLLEAMASGKAVIGTNINGVRELIKDGNNGLLVPSGNPQILANAIVRLLTSPKFKTELGQNARITSEQFDRNKSVLQTLEVYQNLLGGRNEVK